MRVDGIRANVYEAAVRLWKIKNPEWVQPEADRLEALAIATASRQFARQFEREKAAAQERANGEDQAIRRSLAL